MDTNPLSSTSGDKVSLVPPANLAFLRDNEEAYKLLDEVRWRGNVHCPRCNSKFTKEVNTSVFRELTRCLDCGYMFNQLSGTMFQGSKIPLVKHFQLFVAYDASDKKISAREVSYLLDVSDKTSQSLLGRLRGIDYSERFTTSGNLNVGHTSYEAVPQGLLSQDPFFPYCVMKMIFVDTDKFKDFLSSVIIGSNGK